MLYLSRLLAHLLFSLVWWPCLFLLCRIAVWHLAQPAWLTLPLGLGVGALWQIVRSRRNAISRDPFPNTGDAFSTDGLPDPLLDNSLSRSWQAGRRMRRRSVFTPFGPPLLRPCYLCFSRDGDGAKTLLSGLRGVRTNEDGEFVWHGDTNADWLDLPFAWQREGRETWRAFLRRLPENDRQFPITGVTVVVSAETLLREAEPVRRERAELLRRRLHDLAETLGRRVPAYIFVDRLDMLYGWRSLAALLPEKRLAAPLGSFGDGASPRTLIQRAMANAMTLCRIPFPAGTPTVPAALTAAALLASEELLRLEDALTCLCGQAFPAGGRSIARGLFFGSALTEVDGGRTVPPLAASLSTFAPAHEPLPATKSWFTGELARRRIPADSTRPGSRETTAGRHCLWLHAGTAGLLLGTLVLCWLMTFSFAEARRVLLSAAGRAKYPEKAEELQPYLELAAATRLRSGSGILPRFGMTEPQALADELERRYSESYFDLKTVPGVEQVQDAALAASRSGDAVAMGNSLLMLSLARDGISRNLGDPGSSPARSAFLQKLAVSLSLASDNDMKQLDAYFAWAGRQEWMPDTLDALLRFEKHLFQAADPADWLPIWLDSLPQLHSPGGVAGAVRSAWTRQGYAVLRELLSTVACGDEQTGDRRTRREAILAAFRRRALNAWLEAASSLSGDMEASIADEEIKGLLRRAARREDPATRFAALACEHLLPMFDDGEAGSAVSADTGPEVAWLRLWRQLAGSRQRGVPNGATDGGVLLQLAEAVRRVGSDDLGRLSAELGLDAPEGNDAARHWRRLEEQLPSVSLLAESPGEFLRALRRQFMVWEQYGRPASGQDDAIGALGQTAQALTSSLRAQSGSGGWDAVSPSASHDHLRRLIVRLAAAELDALWRSSVYDPCMLTPGGMQGRYARLGSSGGLLETFLTGEAAGFWTWRQGRIAAATWDGLAFPFTDEFLDFCNQTRRLGNEPPAQSVTLPLAVRAVSVVGAAREHPIATEFTLACGEDERVVTHRNYPVKKPLLWTRPEGDSLDGIKASIRIQFPSVTAAIEFAGEEGVRRFAAMLGEGKCVLRPEDFGKTAPALHRMGVEEIVIQVTMNNADLLLRELDKRAFRLPRSIVRRESAPAPSAAIRTSVL